MLDYNVVLESLRITQHEHAFHVTCLVCEAEICLVEHLDLVAMYYDLGVKHLEQHEQTTRRRVTIHGCDISAGDIIRYEDGFLSPVVAAVYSARDLTAVAYIDGTTATFTDDQTLSVWRTYLG